MSEDLYIGHGDPNYSDICWCASSWSTTLVSKLSILTLKRHEPCLPHTFLEKSSGIACIWGDKPTCYKEVWFLWGLQLEGLCLVLKQGWGFHLCLLLKVELLPMIYTIGENLRTDLLLLKRGAVDLIVLLYGKLRLKCWVFEDLHSQLFPGLAWWFPNNMEYWEPHSGKCLECSAFLLHGQITSDNIYLLRKVVYLFFLSRWYLPKRGSGPPVLSKNNGNYALVTIGKALMSWGALRQFGSV